MNDTLPNIFIRIYSNMDIVFLILKKEKENNHSLRRVYFDLWES